MILYDFFSQKNACLELVDFETINIRNKKTSKIEFYIAEINLRHNFPRLCFLSIDYSSD